MNCPRCGQPSTSGAAFCMKCGQALSPMQPVGGQAIPAGAAFQVALEAEQRKRTTILAIIAAVAIVMALIIGLSAGGILKFGSNGAAEALKAQGQVPGPALTAQGQAPTPDLTVQAEAPKKMPQDVLDWLRHLEKCERMKSDLTEQQSGELKDIMVQGGIGGLTESLVKQITDPEADMPENPMWENLRKAVAKMGPEWDALKRFFQSKPPPVECQRIADNYSEGLHELPTTMNELVQTIERIGRPGHLDETQRQDARNEAQRIRKSHRTMIDESFRKTDQGVADICRKYDTLKWFSIDAGGGGGGSDIMGLFGF